MKKILSTLLLFFVGVSGFGINSHAQLETNTINNYTVANNRVFKNGEQINLYGLNWFGFEDENLRIHGSWERSITDIILQIKELGFNSLRVPICSQTLDNKPVGFVDYELNHEYKNLRSLEFLDKFLHELEQNEVYFVLSHHSIDCQGISPLWYTDEFSETDWIDDLVFVANRYRANNYFLGLDLKNENHNDNGENYPQWGSGNLQFDWRLAAQKAGQAVNQTNPNILIFVGGIENGQDICSKDDQFLWGENFMPVKCLPINNQYIPANKLVYSPHIYGPDVYTDIEYFQDLDFPNNMPQIWEDHFGYLTTEDYNYTLIPGEFGGKYGLETETGLGEESDVGFQNKLVDYFIEKGICNFYYWSLNPNSDDTGGILDQDWVTPVESKLENIARLISHCENIEKILPIDNQNIKTLTTEELAPVELPLDTDQGGWSIKQFQKNSKNNPRNFVGLSLI